MRSVSAGYDFACALPTDATVWCRGSDFDGELGDGTQGDADNVRLIPVKVIFLI